MSNCLNCTKELEPKEGKREKKFCNDNCRASYYSKNTKKKEPKYVQFKSFQSLKEQLDKAKEENVALRSKIDYKATDKESYEGKSVNTATIDEVGLTEQAKPANYPEKIKGESGFDYRVKCAVWYDEQKSKKA